MEGVGGWKPGHIGVAMGVPVMAGVSDGKPAIGIMGRLMLRRELAVLFVGSSSSSDETTGAGPLTTSPS